MIIIMEMLTGASRTLVKNIKGNYIIIIALKIV